MFIDQQQHELQHKNDISCGIVVFHPSGIIPLMYTVTYMNSVNLQWPINLLRLIVLMLPLV